MSPKARQAQTVMEVALRGAGFRRGWKACLYLAQWGIAADDVGRALNASEVSRWWEESTATTYRNEAAFKAAFPNEVSPERLWKLAHVRGSDLASVVPVIAATRWAA